MAHMIERYRQHVVPLVVLFAFMAPDARAETPPPLAFEWWLDFPPGQISIDPNGNLWFIGYSTKVYRALRDGNPLDARGVASDLACDPHGNAFEAIDNSVRLAHADGIVVCQASVLGAISVAADAEDGVYATLGLNENPTRLVHITSNCSTEDLFDPGFLPGDLAVGGDGTLFLIDPSQNRIVHFDVSGTTLGTWSLPEREAPIVLASHPDGNLLIGGAHHVFKYDASGTLLTSWGSAETFAAISGIAVNRLGDVYVCDAGNQRIQMYGVRQPTDNPPVPPPPPPPSPPPPPPLTSHPAAVLLHIAPSAGHETCTISAKLDSVITAESASPDDGHHSIVYLIATPNPNVNQICGVQVGIAYDPGRDGHPALEVLGWHLCADLEFSGDNWPGTGSGNTITWASNYSTDVNVCGYFEVIAHGPVTMSVIPWPNTGLAKIANCWAEYVLEVPPDRLGWVSWGHAGFGTDTDGCNPVLEPCGGGVVPVRPSTWGRLKNLYGH